MRHEVIKLTDKAIYPELIKLLSGNGDVWGDMLAEYKHKFKILFQNGRWTRAYPQYKADYTITDVDFIQKYGENTAPEPAPAWTFKTDDNLKSFVAGFLSGNFANFEEYVEMIRKPAFELVTADNVRVTDPEQIVYWVSSSVSKGKASDMKQWGCLCWASESAALNHRRHNTPAIKLSDMTLFAETYILSKEEAENLVNERINGK